MTALKKLLGDVLVLPKPKRKDTNAAPMAKARRLIKKHSLPLEIESYGDGCWSVWPVGDIANDPCEGEHYCNGGVEVLEMVETYVRHFDK